MAVKISSGTNGSKTTDNSNNFPGMSITEAITNGFFTVDRKWTVTYWNKSAEKLLGVLAKDIVGQNIWEKFAATIPLNFYAFYHKAFLQDIPVHFEEYWGEMGTWFDVITYHCDDTLSVSFKNSNQRVSESPVQQLKTLNELYRFVTEVTNDCLWEWEFQTHEIFWIDGGHKRVFNYQIENAIIPQSFWESCIHPDDKERVLAKFNKIITEGSASEWEEEYRFKRADGEFAFVHDRGHIIYGADKKASRMVGATQDITSRKLTEMQLLESEKKLSLIARQTESALIITEGEEKITWVNSSFTRITEYKPEEVIGRRLGSFLQGKETDGVTLHYLREKVKDKQPFDCEIINYSKSGRKYWMHIQGQPLLDENGKCDQYFVIQTDITEKVLMEKKLMLERLTKQREITAAVLTAQENERADIGKELHDNLNQILGATKLYIESAKTDAENREMYLEKSCGFIVDVMEEIRRISKTLVIPGMHLIGLFDSIRTLLDDIIIIHPMEIEFHDEHIDEHALDKKLQLNIFRIVQEQFNNILRHSKATRATINLSRHEDQITLMITDNGEGCDTSKEKNGVGIINIKSRAELYGGGVTIVSSPGEGFELKVVLHLNERV